MSLICLSFSHQHVPIAFREQIYFDSNAVANACARFCSSAEQPSSLIELSILSTCNRTEIYAFSRDVSSIADASEVKEEILGFVRQSRSLVETEFLRLGTWIIGPDVVGHLARVACGLESVVLGEPQILGQVGDAMRLGLVLGSTGPVLTKAFQTAIRAGRRARSDTQINKHSLNLATVAVNAAEDEIGELSGKTVVVLGAGEMADLAISQLSKKGVNDIRVVSRTIAKANELAFKHRGKAFVFEHIGSLLRDADVLISSTGAPFTLIQRDMIQVAMESRPTRPMMILDIAVPRDVESSVESIENVSRRDIDDLNRTTGKSMRLRQAEIPRVEKIIDVELALFLDWYRGLGVEPTIARLRQKTEAIRKIELERLSNLLPDLDQDSWSIIERFSESLVNKIFHDPTNQLRQVHGTRNAMEHSEAIRQVFCLQSNKRSAAKERSA